MDLQHIRLTESCKFYGKDSLNRRRTSTGLSVLTLLTECHILADRNPILDVDGCY
jgi:hypothetical protein